jgi:hypothetical protein
MRLTRYHDRETLERIKRWPNLLNRFKLVRIYSAQWGAYWLGAGQGYTDDKEKSQVLPCAEAVRRTVHCGPEKRIQFVQA